MMNRTYWLLATPLLIAAAAPIAPDTRNDVRCLLAISALAENSDPSIKMAAMLGAQYYFGRVDGRVPPLDLEQVMLSEAAKLKDADIPLLLKACGERMEARGAALSGIGKRMQEMAAHSSSSSS
jgi:hypothetical protein